MRRLNKYDGIKTIEEYKTYYEDTSKDEILNDTYLDFINYVAIQNNWNELKEELQNKITTIKTNFSQVNGNYFMMNDRIEILEDTLDKMQEIESRK